MPCMCAYPHTYVLGMLTFRPLVTPGVSASTINPVNPLNPFLMSGSVRASTKYLVNKYILSVEMRYTVHYSTPRDRIKCIH